MGLFAHLLQPVPSNQFVSWRKRVHAIPDLVRRVNSRGGGIENLLQLDMHGSIFIRQLSHDGAEAVNLTAPRPIRRRRWR